MGGSLWKSGTLFTPSAARTSSLFWTDLAFSITVIESFLSQVKRGTMHTRRAREYGVTHSLTPLSSPPRVRSLNPTLFLFCERRYRLI